MREIKMLVYRDMTFCDYYKKCMSGKECPRAYTKEAEALSISFGLPVPRYVDKPDCFGEIK